VNSSGALKSKLGLQDWTCTLSQSIGLRVWDRALNSLRGPESRQMKVWKYHVLAACMKAELLPSFCDVQEGNCFLPRISSRGKGQNEGGKSTFRIRGPTVSPLWLLHLLC